MQCNYYVLDNCHVPVYMFSESVIKYYYYYYYNQDMTVTSSLTLLVGL